MSSPGSRMREIRRKLGLNQQQFADTLGMGTSNLSRIERDEYLPSKACLELMKAKHNINPGWLTDGQEPVYLPRENKPGESEKSALEQTINVMRFIEDNGYNKQMVSYLLYQAVHFPTYPFQGG